MIYRHEIVDCSPPIQDKIYLNDGTLHKQDYHLDQNLLDYTCENTYPLITNVFQKPYDTQDDFELAKSDAFVRAKEILDKYRNDNYTALREISKAEAGLANYFYQTLDKPDVTGEIRETVINRNNGSKQLRSTFDQHGHINDVVRQQIAYWQE